MVKEMVLIVKSLVGFFSLDLDPNAPSFTMFLPSTDNIDRVSSSSSSLITNLIDGLLVFLFFFILVKGDWAV